MITKEKPLDFNKQFDVVGCFVEHNGKFLLLRRHSHKRSGDKWGLPAGKMDDGETISQAMLREIEEETGLKIPEVSVVHFDSLYVRDGSLDIKWHMFGTRLDAKPTIKLSPHEHSEYRWVTPEEALEMDLIHDQAESIRLFYGS